MPTNNAQPTTNDELLSCRNITKSFFGVRVLKSVGFKVGTGRIIGLVG